MTSSVAPAWAIDFPGLSRKQALDIANFVLEARLAENAIPADPALFLTLHLDRPTVEALVRAASSALRALDGGTDAPVLRGMIEDFEEWLHRAE